MIFVFLVLLLPPWAHAPAGPPRSAWPGTTRCCAAEPQPPDIAMECYGHPWIFTLKKYTNGDASIAMLVKSTGGSTK